MGTKRIEIRPGFFIAVSELHKRKNGRYKYSMIHRTDISESEREAIAQAISPIKRRKRRYTLAQLDEAVKLSRTIGRRKAAEAMGVNEWSLVGRIRWLMNHGKMERTGTGGHPKPRYTMEQKRACVDLAQKLINGGMCQGPAFSEAGRRMGMSGQSILKMVGMNLIK